MQLLLQTYCDYLNNWGVDDPSPFHYTPANFGFDMGDGKGVNEYGTARVLTEVDMLKESEYVIWVVLVGDEDEGGPAELLVWWEEVSDWVWDVQDISGHKVPRGWVLNDGIQTFDTYRNFFIKEGITQGPDGGMGELKVRCRDDIGQE